MNLQAKETKKCQKQKSKKTTKVIQLLVANDALC